MTQRFVSAKRNKKTGGMLCYVVMSVLNKQYYHINGEWKKELDEEEQKIYDAFINTEYYYSHNLWEH